MDMGMCLTHLTMCHASAVRRCDSGPAGQTKTVVPAEMASCSTLGAVDASYAVHHVEVPPWPNPG